jgi:hypothetical protein
MSAIMKDFKVDLAEAKGRGMDLPGRFKIDRRRYVRVE